MVDLISWLNSQSYFHLAPFFTRFSRERTARFENDAQGSCYISPQKESTRGRTLTELSAVNTGHAARGFTTPREYGRTKPFSFVSSRSSRSTTRRHVSSFSYSLSFFPFFFPFSLFFFTNPRGERKGRVALKEFGDSFFFSGTNAGTLAELNESVDATGHAPVPPEVTCLTVDP